MSRTPLARLSSRTHQRASTRMGSFTHMSILSLTSAVSLIVGTGVHPGRVRAQEVRAVADAGTGAVDGVVTNTAGAGVRGVRVRISGQEQWVTTDRDGSYHIARVPAGTRVVQFLFTDDVGVAIPADVTSDAVTGVDPVLPEVPRGSPLYLPATGPVVVRYGPSAAIAGFVDRARHGGGYYFTRAQIVERNGRVTDIIGSVPGLTLAEGRVTLRNRSAFVAAPTCEGVALYVDGTLVPNDDGALSLLDARSLTEIAGIEVYTRPGPVLPVPVQFGRSCAVVMVWSLNA